MSAYLLKSKACNTLGADTAEIPRRMCPALLPAAGDTLFLWANAAGLIEEAVVTSTSATSLQVTAITRYGRPLPAAWFDGADRQMGTIRSKLHCDRHDRLWLLSDAEVRELDAARRSWRT